jgi:hypothetical protein
MRHSQFATVLFFSASISGAYAAGSPKTVDCLLVSVVPQSANPELALNPTPMPPGTRPLHMILTNACSVDITAFMLDIYVTSPVPQELRPGKDLIGSVTRPDNKDFRSTGSSAASRRTTHARWSSPLRYLA